MKKKLMMILCFFAAVSPALAQQDAQFGQYIFNGLYINPAYAGYRGMWNVNAFYRNQWSGFPGAPKTFSVALDGVAREGKYGLGLNISNDQLGLQANTSLYASYAFRIPVGGEESGRKFSIGISAGMIQNRIKVSDYDPTDPTAEDETLYNSLRTKLTPDARIGIYYNSDLFFAGLSADNLISQAYNAKKDPENIFTERKVHLYATVGGLIPLSEAVQLKPTILVKEDFAGPTTLDINAFVLLHQILWIGAGYRTVIFHKSSIQDDLRKSGAVIGMAEVFIGQKIRIGYAYEYTTNVVGMGGYPTNEISLSYFFMNPKAKMLSPRYF